MADNLTPEQRQAVENRGGKLLVSAAAGSGKTKVLVDRLMGYILDPVNPANIDDFLIITYTKAAAAELRGKIASKLSETIANSGPNKHLQQQIQRLYLAKISTVHGFCGDVIRQYAYRLDVSADFRVADEGEVFQLQLKALDQVLNDAYEKAEENSAFYTFVDSQGLGRDDRQIPEIILKVYNSARCHLHPEKWLDWCISGEHMNVTDAGQTPWGTYLMGDLKVYLRMQIAALKKCVEKAAYCEGIDKPVALFESTIAQLQALYECNTWDEIVQRSHIDYGRLVFSKNCTDMLLAEQMKAVREECKTGLTKRLRAFTDNSHLILVDHANVSTSVKGLISLVRAFSKEYDRLKRNQNILDFGDLEHKTLDLLLGSRRDHMTAVANEVASCFREIMVDEYQDSNEIQDAIFSAISNEKQNCFMVGDVKQSIYQFRLADPSIFIEKYNTYAPADSAKPGEGRKVLLSHNFRSSAGVISGVNDVFLQCMTPMTGGIAYGEEEMLREGIPHISVNEPEVSLYGIDVDADTYLEEAEFVSNKICELLDGAHFVRDGDRLRPILPEDIVILLRSPGSMSDAFENAFQSKGIRFVTGDSADLLQTDEIAIVRSILEIVHNPLQDIPMVAALTSPVFGYTAEELADLRSESRGVNIYKMLFRSGKEKDKKFISVLNDLRTDARLLSVTQLLTKLYCSTNLISIFSAMQNGSERLNNLQEFFQIVSDYENTGPRELGRLLDYLKAAEERGLSRSAGQADTGAVSIMSIHKSKGLEFPVVFLCGLSRGFNHESAYAQVLCDKDLGLGLGCADQKLRARYPSVAKRAISAKIIKEGISEELRVLYVAMTRARDRLIMTYAAKNLGKKLAGIGMRLDVCGRELLASEVDCMGDWVLQTALSKTEAGEFFELAGSNPGCASVSEIPWHIEVISTSDMDSDVLGEEQQESTSADGLREKFHNYLQFCYPYIASTRIPSKLTATQLKGRFLDDEVADGTHNGKHHGFRKIGAAGSSKGKEYGNAYHAVMQYIRFSSCGDLNGIRDEIIRMTNERLISQEQTAMVDANKLLAFFQSPIGLKLQNCDQVLREFKFSILDNANKYYPDADEEQILLQGVIDCAFIEKDGITVIDFKTDDVTDDTIPAAVQKYRSQVLTYADALSRIYQMPVKSAMLYFFSVNRFEEVLYN